MCKPNHLLILLLGLLPSFQAMGALYKWVDERGVTQYSETPPGPGRKAQALNVGPAASTPKEPAKSIQEQERAFRERRVERSQAERDQEEKKAQEKALAVRRQMECIDARRDLQALTASRPVYTLNEKGEQVYIEDSERPALIKDAQKSIELYCSK